MSVTFIKEIKQIKQISVEDNKYLPASVPLLMKKKEFKSRFFGMASNSLDQRNLSTE